ncbi:hypothetical protein ZWY2020_042080 [Hordeum vulgare]|nr:hypothetical protein ZWY2020_042080 [Hordeum vulgare]
MVGWTPTPASIQSNGNHRQTGDLLAPARSTTSRRSPPPTPPHHAPTEPRPPCPTTPSAHHRIRPPHPRRGFHHQIRSPRPLVQAQDTPCCRRRVSGCADPGTPLDRQCRSTTAAPASRPLCPSCSPSQQESASASCSMCVVVPAMPRIGSSSIPGRCPTFILNLRVIVPAG